MTKDQFYLGMRVKQIDPDEGHMAYGHIKEIKDKSVIIKWGDMDQPTEHEEWEWPTIHIGNPS
jgi:hypothetical protein